MQRAHPLRALAALVVATGLARSAQAQHDLNDGQVANAVVVLIGEANRSPELVVVLSELLSRRGVQPQFTPKPRFEPSTLLDAGAGDARVWVFVAPYGGERVRLYFRGPFGERFLLRELALRDGLDEVGRELIARVVETATVALLHSAEGMSRKEAEEAVAKVEAEPGPEPGPGPGPGPGPEPGPEQEPGPEPEQEPGPEQEPEQEPEPEREPGPEPEQEPEPELELGPEPDSVSSPWLVGLHLAGAWTGSALGARYGLGLDVARTLVHDPWPRLRARAVFEPSLSQTLEHPDVNATVTSWPIRLGLDGGVVFGPHAVLLGVAGGIDVVWTSPEAARGSSLTLSESRTRLLPAARAELRYELALSPVLLSLALLVDAPLADTHYDVMQGGERMTIARPLQVRPGIALGCGARL